MVLSALQKEKLETLWKEDKLHKLLVGRAFGSRKALYHILAKEQHISYEDAKRYGKDYLDRPRYVKPKEIRNARDETTPKRVTRGSIRINTPQSDRRRRNTRNSLQTAVFADESIPEPSKEEEEPQAGSRNGTPKVAHRRRGRPPAQKEPEETNETIVVCRRRSRVSRSSSLRRVSTRGVKVEEMGQASKFATEPSVPEKEDIEMRSDETPTVGSPHSTASTANGIPQEESEGLLDTASPKDRRKSGGSPAKSDESGNERQKSATVDTSEATIAQGVGGISEKVEDLTEPLETVSNEEAPQMVMDEPAENAQSNSSNESPRPLAPVPQESESNKTEAQVEEPSLHEVFHQKNIRHYQRAQIGEQSAYGQPSQEILSSQPPPQNGLPVVEEAQTNPIQKESTGEEQILDTDPSPTSTGRKLGRAVIRIPRLKFPGLASMRRGSGPKPRRGSGNDGTEDDVDLEEEAHDIGASEELLSELVEFLPMLRKLKEKEGQAETLDETLNRKVEERLPEMLEKKIQEILPAEIEKRVEEVLPATLERRIEELLPDLVDKRLEELLPQVTINVVLREVLQKITDSGAMHEVMRNFLGAMVPQAVNQLLMGKLARDLQRLMDATLIRELERILSERMPGLQRSMAEKLPGQIEAWLTMFFPAIYNKVVSGLRAYQEERDRMKNCGVLSQSNAGYQPDVTSASATPENQTQPQQQQKSEELHHHRKQPVNGSTFRAVPLIRQSEKLVFQSKRQSDHWTRKVHREESLWQDLLRRQEEQEENEPMFEKRKRQKVGQEVSNNTATSDSVEPSSTLPDQFKVQKSSKPQADSSRPVQKDGSSNIASILQAGRQSKSQPQQNPSVEQSLGTAQESYILVPEPQEDPDATEDEAEKEPSHIQPPEIESKQAPAPTAEVHKPQSPEPQTEQSEAPIAPVFRKPSPSNEALRRAWLFARQEAKREADEANERLAKPEESRKRANREAEELDRRPTDGAEFQGLYDVPPTPHHRHRRHSGRMPLAAPQKSLFAPASTVKRTIDDISDPFATTAASLPKRMALEDGDGMSPELDEILGDRFGKGW
ncbi:hypothetical protein BJ508DRAFT_379033 [Ascobolus immersus RN42]|uniref:Uncharacterized protein n=1 Tax=Ascobolus immersus RN42 TaxID=1160509 RepID=A0A3N4HVT8_ASCIM|nr:hypothetical protein BJ508DRAFT_379033 [Ascobolus immersus RN42]